MGKYFTNCKTLEDVKKEYKKLVMILHPDVSGKDTTAAFQEMQNDYEQAFARCKNIHAASDGKTYTKETNETAAEYADIISKLLTMPGVVVEIIGSFLWLSGNTKEHKDEIKALGFRWSKNKVMWYKAPEGYHKTSKKAYDINSIRGFFGSEIINQTMQLCK